MSDSRDTMPELTVIPPSPDTETVLRELPNIAIVNGSAATKVESLGSQFLESVVYRTGPECDHDGKTHISGRVIIASNLIPLELKFGRERKWEIIPRRGNTALHSSFQHLASQHSSWKTILVGWTGAIQRIAEDKKNPIASSTPGVSKPGLLRRTASGVPNREPEEALKVNKFDREALEKKLLENQNAEGNYGIVVPVWLGDEEGGSNAGLTVDGDWERWSLFSQKVLWPLLHYILPTPTDGYSERRWWRDYLRFNHAFADKIMEIFQPGDIIWIHDFQLLLLPEILRQRAGSNVNIGLFIHTPFPSSEVVRCIARRKEILEGMLGANLIGFQSASYAQHFLSSCTRILCYETSADGVKTFGSYCSVAVFPIGIDAPKVEANAMQPGIEEKMKAIKEMYAGKKIIVGRDRLDSVRGVMQKLRAFEAFLEMYPEWRDKVVLIQVTSPAASESTKIEHKVNDLVGHINGTYGSLEFTPVQHYPQYLAPDEYLALLRVADLGLITSVRDGMNTTSLEYVVCQKGTHGPVILSEFTGTVGSLQDAISVNPWDTKGVARTIDHCLRILPETKKEIHSKLYKFVTTNTVQAWNCKFLKMLLQSLNKSQEKRVTPVLDRRLLLEAYLNGRKRLLMFDYDGTLTPIVQDPDAAIPTDKVIRTIKKLAADPNNEVWIISGRDQEFLAKWLGDIPELGLSAEHGCFMRYPHSSQWENLTEKANMSWQEKVLDTFGQYTEKTPGTFIEKKKVSITWHYRKADRDFAALQVAECQARLESTIAKEYDLEVMPGKCNLEIRPTFVNKGEIAKKLVERYKETNGGQTGFLLCAGDDTTDEDMFKALRSSDLARQEFFTVHIGPESKPTVADYHLVEPGDLIDSIELLVGVVNPADLGIVPAVIEAQIAAPISTTMKNEKATPAPA